MKTKNKYFLGLTLLVSGLFLFDCFSIIFCVLKMNSVPEDKRVENAMGFVYLFLHLIILAVGQMPLVAGLGIDLVRGEVNEGSPYITKDPKVWVCGDIAHSAYDKTVVGGVRTGKEVAFYIDAAIGGK